MINTLRGEKMKSVLLIGQSNMAGRGFLDEVEPIYNEKIFMLRNGRWQMVSEPIHFDRSVAGVGPAASFAQAWSLENSEEQIGLIPCAEGVAEKRYRALEQFTLGKITLEEVMSYL